MTSENQFNKVITKALLNHNFPGISIAVSHSRGQLLTFSDGLTDANSGLLISPDTLFSVASLTKFLTALIIMQAERLGHLSVTDLVVQYYPALQCAQDSKMQLKHLLTHSSGLPGLPCRFLAKNLTEQNSSDSGLQLLTTEDLVAHINQLEPELLAPPGALYSYSNESYCILGGIIETVFQLPYPEVAKKLIFEPLALHNSAIGGKQARINRTSRLGCTFVLPCGWAADNSFRPNKLICSTKRRQQTTKQAAEPPDDKPPGVDRLAPLS